MEPEDGMAVTPGRAARLAAREARMLVSMWMTRDVIVIPPTTPVADAAVEMGRRRVRRLVVGEVGARGPRLLGIVSARDVARAYPPDVNPLSAVAGERGPRQPVSTVMARQVKTIAPDAPLEDAARMLVEHKVGAVPVVDDGRVEGIITESDIFRAFVEASGGGGRGVRVTFDVSATHDVVSLLAEAGPRHAMRVASMLTFEHDGTRLGVARLTGQGSDAFIDDLRRSGHRVLSVSRIG
jgi:CBS domain-containing protein